MRNKRSFSMKKDKQNLAKGGKAKGPDHEQGGISAEIKGTQVAEIEGEERVFSKEDTKEIEKDSDAINTLVENGQQEEADEAAMKLGYKVAAMIRDQDMNDATQEADYSEIANSFNYGEDD